MADKPARPDQDSDVTTIARCQNPLACLRDEVDRLFDSFFPPAFGRPLLDLDPSHGRAFRIAGEAVPRVDVTQCADHYEIAAELPGIERDSVAVAVKDGMLSIAGEMRAQRRTGRGSERRFERFVRLFRLPRDADARHIDAAFDQGVLTVTVPRQDGASQEDRQVEVGGR